jgi:hypothetical protein
MRCLRQSDSHGAKENMPNCESINLLAYNENQSLTEAVSHYVCGKCYLLKLEETDFTPHTEFRHHRLAERIRSDTNIAARQALFDAFYRRQIRAKVGSMIAKWEPILQVKVNRVLVQRMKTK